jgi:hypothetical protein
MRSIEQLICVHDYERQAVYLEAGKLVKKCRKCGKRVRETRATARLTAI